MRADLDSCFATLQPALFYTLNQIFEMFEAYKPVLAALTSKPAQKEAISRVLTHERAKWGLKTA